MRHDRLLQIQIEPPTAGWLVVTFETATATVECGPSAIPSDPIGDLLSALLVVAQSPAPAQFQWNEEPILVAGRFQPIAQDIHFTLTRGLPPAPSDLLLEITAPRIAILRPFWRALRRLQSQLSPAAYAAQLGHAFPMAAMNQLTAWMHTYRATHES